MALPGFDCHPNFSIYVYDEHIKDILQLQIKTYGFDMKKKRTNIFVHTGGCFRHTNTLYHVVLHTPRKESKSSTLVITDAHNQKIEHQTIKWEDLSFPKNWVVDLPNTPKIQSITTTHIQ